MSRVILLAALVACVAIFSSSSVAGQSCGNDTAVLNFALNLEYLEANFYSCAVSGSPISRSLWGVSGVRPTGCKKAKLSPAALAYATAIAGDELKHVKVLRAALGSAAVSQPALDIGTAFSVAANAAFNTTLPVPFSAYGSDVLFYHAAFIFEDVGVTAYKGAAALITCKNYLEAAAGILATEAYHGGSIRSLLLKIANQYVFPYGVPVQAIVSAISGLRAAASGAADDEGLLTASGQYVIAPSDSNSIAYSRTTSQVLSVVYLGGTSNGGFFPNGLNGAITSTSG